MKKGHLITIFFMIFVLAIVGCHASCAASAAESIYMQKNNDTFTWDNATIYFAITDRFYNANEENDHSYGRSLGEIDADEYKTRVGTFHGGDLEGLTEKIKEGYFDKLGANVIWFTAPYEQIHGAVCGDGFKHYAYHGYYPLDFTKIDENMGTEEEVKEFVDTAHEHGIRVIMDIVMNHVGYADPVTAAEYGFGGVTSEWKEIYYNTPETDYNWIMDYSSLATAGKATLNSDADWSNWWGNNWVRAVTGRYQGYEGSQFSDNYTLCLGGLPDIKTEVTVDNGIPPILQTKWEKEGRLEQESRELDEFFCTSGLKRKNVNYLVKWLTDYVREYGIDGFRCDSVKHVEMEHWKTLKEQANIALVDWRKNNPDNVAANWDEEFWMVGEDFDFNNNKDMHFTQGGFDAMVNLQFQNYSYCQSETLDGTYANYSEKIQDDGFNMLSYISSHDMGLGNRTKTGGTALLLCPGAVQIYYGDESGRTTNGIEGEQGWRTQMNWETVDTKVLEHYQILGQFRKNHPAIASGVHNMISTSPYTFSRTSEEYDDKVVVSVPKTVGTWFIPVSDIFSEGEIVRDFYTGKEYQVSAGSVQVECDNNCVILLESTGVIKASVGAKLVANTLPYKTETITVRLYENDLAEAYYSINEGKIYTKYMAGKMVTFGGGTAYGDTVTLLLKGIKTDGTLIEKKYNYQRCEEPTEAKFSISVLKSEFNEAPYCYIYTSNGTYKNEYPGELMGDDGEYWTLQDDELEAGYVILSQGDWRSTEHGAHGMEITGRKVYSKETQNIREKTENYGIVTVRYEDVDGNLLKTVYRKGVVGTSYKTSSAYIYGYFLREEPENALGIYGEDMITVVYRYVKDTSVKDITLVPTEEPLVIPTITPTVTSTPVPAKMAAGEFTYTIKSGSKKLNLTSTGRKTTYKTYLNKKITIKAGSAEGNVYYQVVKSGKKVSSKGWKKVNRTITINSSVKAAIYIKYTSNEKTVVKRTKGFVLDTEAPSVKVSKTGKIIAKDNLSGIKSIKDGKKTVKNNSTLKKGLHKVTVTDKAGNKKTIKVIITDDEK